jgi:hypothetical protein
METVPASIRLPGLEEVAVNAAEVAKTATPAMTASTAMVMKIRSFRRSESFVCIAPAPSGDIRYRVRRLVKVMRRRRGKDGAALHVSDVPSPV